MHRFVAAYLTVAALAAVAPPAIAADPAAVPVVAEDWAGWYAGIAGGGVFPQRLRQTQDVVRIGVNYRF